MRTLPEQDLYDAIGNVVWSDLGNTIVHPDIAATFSGINTWGTRFRVQMDETDYLHLIEVAVNADDSAISGPPNGGTGAIPEPSTYVLVGGGLGVAALLRRRLGRAC